ncbi:MAG TPA: multicopper oxidase domain-containing protein [Jatrophihabitans sp.]|jgi:spore coat protein A|uniref:multicopper oxidase family protein n=1 Tax=Jatrophihabitans sp. TaxID=1932789 RepID=UPI002EEFB249
MARQVSRRAFVSGLAVVGGTAALGGYAYSELQSGGKSVRGIAGPALTFGKTGNTSPMDGLTDNLNQLSSDLPLPRPFTVRLPIPQVLTPRRVGDTDHYHLRQTRARQEIIPGHKTEIWGYNGVFPGPTIISRRDRRTVVTHTNELPVPTVVHLHGGHTPPHSDGYPTDYLTSDESVRAMPHGSSATGHMPPDPKADVRHHSRAYTYPMDQPAATLWYHDHRMDFTGASVYRGLAGFHLIRDEQEMALPLPSGARDVPLMICDRAFAADGALKYPSADAHMMKPGVEDASLPGVMGDVILVNGAPWPLMDVETARYRFRVLNACNARVLRLALDSPRTTPAMVQIGSDAGLLAKPVSHEDLVIAPGQRFEIVLDFSAFHPGDEITLLNKAGAGSTGVVMRFRVAGKVADTSSIPDKLADVEPIPASKVQRHRTLDFHRAEERGWWINNKFFTPTESIADVPRGAIEKWTFVSDYHHPVHVHLVSFQVVSRNGGPPGPYDAGWKDTVFVNGSERVDVIARFHGEAGRYILHCHNLEHEDMSMMATFNLI